MSGPTDPAEAHFDKGLWGFDGTQWRKLPLLWGYTGTVQEVVSNEDAAAGLNSLFGTVVPAGEVHVIQNLVAYNIVSGITQIAVGAYKSSLAVYAFSEYATTAGKVYTWTGNMVLKAGDRIFAQFFGCTAGDSIWITLDGYKMSVVS